MTDEVGAKVEAEGIDDFTSALYRGLQSSSDPTPGPGLASPSHVELGDQLHKSRRVGFHILRVHQLSGVGLQGVQPSTLVPRRLEFHEGKVVESEATRQVWLAIEVAPELGGQGTEIGKFEGLPLLRTGESRCEADFRVIISGLRR